MVAHLCSKITDLDIDNNEVLHVSSEMIHPDGFFQSIRMNSEGFTRLHPCPMAWWINYVFARASMSICVCVFVHLSVCTEAHACM